MSKRKLLPILFALQFLIVAVLCFGDIGFDRPGRFGLDFGDFLLLMASYLAVLGWGLAYAAFNKQWRWMAIQGMFPLVAYAAVYFFLTSKVNFNAATNQHLVGMSKTEVHSLLGQRNRITSGAGSSRVGSKQIDYEFESYQGMTVYYRPNGSVIAVERSGETKFLSK
jgi:hypothetical protein